MVCCELDDAVSGEALGWPLPAWQALLLHRVLPSCGGLLLYLTLVCFDFALAVEHYQNGDIHVGTFCVILMVLPALASLVFTLASPPPGLRTEEAALSVTLQRDDLAWILQQIVNFFAFPIAAICRYCHQIFWSVEAVCGARAGDTRRAREALLRVRAPSPLELYLFLQAYLHSAPHALLNVLDMLAYREQPSFDKISVQAVSIIVSMMRMASTATVYRRFEREKLCGRRYPWAIETQALLNNDKTVESGRLIGEADEAAPLEPAAVTSNFPSVLTRNTMTNNLNTDQNKSMDKSYSFINNLASRLSVSSSGSEDYLTPVTPEVIQPDQYFEKPVRPKSVIERVAPKRASTVYNIVHIDVPPPPAARAPRPLSLAAWAEKIVENAETLPEKMSAPPRRRHGPEVYFVDPVAATSGEDVPIPVATPRSYMRGLEPQDASAAVVHYLAWYLFLVARILSLAVFLQAHPVAGIVVILCHYQLMLLLLIVPQASTLRRTFYVFLAFVYVFCLLEFKVRFRHVRAWHVFWLVLVTAETVVLMGVWSSLGGGGVDWWWRGYVISVVLGGMLLSYMCMLVYFVLLKPRETVVYLDSKH